MTDCVACDRARTDPNTGVTQLGCRGCLVRRLAKAPKFAREAEWARISDPDDCRALKAEVLREVARLQALRTETPNQ